MLAEYDSLDFNPGPRDIDAATETAILIIAEFARRLRLPVSPFPHSHAFGFVLAALSRRRSGSGFGFRAFGFRLCCVRGGFSRPKPYTSFDVYADCRRCGKRFAKYDSLDDSSGPRDRDAAAPRRALQSKQFNRKERRDHRDGRCSLCSLR